MRVSQFPSPGRTWFAFSFLCGVALWAQAFLTYSQSGDPASPLYHDQTPLFSAKKWRRILFTEAEIKADPNLNTLKVASAN
jgi:acyl-homoserine lactone acylase PvdQ